MRAFRSIVFAIFAAALLAALPVVIATSSFARNMSSEEVFDACRTQGGTWTHCCHSIGGTVTANGTCGYDVYSVSTSGSGTVKKRVTIPKSRPVSASPR